MQPAQPVQPQQVNLWDEIDKEVCSLNNDQQAILAKDIVAATKEYPDLFGGITIGNGKIKIGVPGIDKDIVLEAADIDHFKSCLK